MHPCKENCEGSTSYAVVCKRGPQQSYGAGPPAFTISVADEDHLSRLLNADSYSAAMDFINGDADVSGDLIAAVRQIRNHDRSSMFKWLKVASGRIFPTSADHAALDVRFHYDRSNTFYRSFLDTRMVYSAALFRDEHWSLEQAQLAKLDSICKKLDLRQGESFLDIGCGWGALMLHAVEKFGAQASGCTLSRNQYDFVSSSIAARQLKGRTKVWLADYKSIADRFHKIASIGMFEHVGRKGLRGYFQKIHGLLQDDGVFINSGIIRPEPLTEDPETYFLQREVFPGADLAHLSQVIREAENAGFEIRDLTNNRKHYARTCREWVARLQCNAKECIALVGQRTYRTWLLYLAGSAVNFEDGQLDVCEIVMAKRSAACAARV